MGGWEGLMGQGAGHASVHSTALQQHKRVPLPVLYYCFCSLLIYYCFLSLAADAALLSLASPGHGSDPLPLRHLTMPTPYRTCSDGAPRFDLAAAEKLITPGTRLVVVNSPHNPSGAHFSRAEWARLCALCEAAGAYLFRQAREGRQGASCLTACA